MPRATKSPRQAPIEYDQPLSRPVKGAFRVSGLMFGLGALVVIVLAALAFIYLSLIHI